MSSSFGKIFKITTFGESHGVAIGGITPSNAKPLIDAGADFIAVSGAVWNHPHGPAEAVKAFNALLA